MPQQRRNDADSARGRAAARGLLVAAMLVGTTLGLFAMRAAAAAESQCTLEPGPTRAVVRVIDAQTVMLDDKSEVRLIGAMAPVPADAAGEASWPPLEAAEDGLQRLVAGRSVEIRHSAEGRRRDRYGHLLAHLFVLGGSDPIWVQGHMVAHGWARAYGFPDARACLRELLALEAGARQAGLGLWAHAAYQVRTVREPRELLRFLNSYQVIEGQIQKVAELKARVFVNFGTDHRDDFTIVVDRAQVGLFEAAGLDLGSLQGRTVRVRGWIESWNGPLIKATHPEQIEILEILNPTAAAPPARPEHAEVPPRRTTRRDRGRRPAPQEAPRGEPQTDSRSAAE